MLAWQPSGPCFVLSDRSLSVSSWAYVPEPDARLKLRRGSLVYTKAQFGGRLRSPRWLPNLRSAAEPPNRKRDGQPDAEPVLHELRALERERQVARSCRRQRDHHVMREEIQARAEDHPAATGRPTRNRHRWLARVDRRAPNAITKWHTTPRTAERPPTAIAANGRPLRATARKWCQPVRSWSVARPE